MQVLNPPLKQLSELPEQLQTSLTDIVNQIEIISTYSIKHPKYKIAELPESVTSHFQKLPLNIQHKHLHLILRNFLYSAYYNGSWKTVLDATDSAKDLVVQQNWENNSLFGIDLEFYERLHTSNKSEGYGNPDWLILREETDGSLAAYKNGLTLHIQREIHLSSIEKSANPGDIVTVKMPKNVVQNGFYMAVSNLGFQSDQDIIRIYFNLTPEGVVSVMDSLTSQLNALPIAFSFKALYNPDDYGRYDSAVLYFNKHQYDSVHPVLESIYQENQVNFVEQVPLFTKLLAPGLACAEEPDDRFGEQESFGTHRCQIVANGLIDCWEQGNNSPEIRLNSILQHFANQKIELQRPYLNPNSVDIYTPLALGL